jgi:hypothetical protein
MPFCLRLHLARRAALLKFLIVLFIVAMPRPGRAQATTALPKSWNDALIQLADKIAASKSPSTPVMLEVKNISSLDDSYVGALDSAFQRLLKAHSFQVLSSSSPAAASAVQLHLTLSESVEGYVWVVEILGTSDDSGRASNLIVSVPKNEITNGGSDLEYVSLEKRFVWKQPEKFLGFAVLKSPASGDDTLLILETNRLALFKMSGTTWQFASASAIPVVGPLSRDPRGAINTQKNSVTVGEQKCVASPDFAGNLSCTSDRILGGPPIVIPGTPNSLGAPIQGSCQNEFVFLFTGQGDWTQSDTMQGYLTKNFSSPMASSGSAIQFDGPVIYLQADTETSSARAVVHNLKTGNYEGYIVTAICNR